jgi:hypothetical protein
MGRLNHNGDGKPVGWINVYSVTAPTGGADAHNSLAKVLGYVGTNVVELRSSPRTSTLSRLRGWPNTTTVKVQTSTRDLLLELGASRRQSADQIILAALAAMRRDERRQLAAVEAQAIKDDPVDRAEIRAIQEDRAALHAR